MILGIDVCGSGLKDEEELEHQELPHLGKHDREPSSASHGSAPADMTWAAGVHLRQPADLALVLGFPVSSTIGKQNFHLGSERVETSQTTSTSMAAQIASLFFGGMFSGSSSAQNMSAPNVGFTSGIGTTSQTVGVQYSTTVET